MKPLLWMQLKQKVNVTDIKNELVYEYEQILAQINTYDEYEKTIDSNLKLYDDLIMVNKSYHSNICLFYCPIKKCSKITNNFFNSSWI